MTRSQFLFLAAGIVVVAVLVREYFALVSLVVFPFGGDSHEYIAYAQNMLHGLFSQGTTPDGYRTPGYPFLVMLTMLPGGDWYPRLMQAQVVLGALTVIGVMAISSRLFGRAWALLAGMLMALWPHHIVATDEVLSEVLFGFVLTGALWLSIEAMQRRSLAWSVAAGTTFGLAYLVNPLIALFPIAIAIVFWRAGMLRNGLALALVAMIAVCAWSARNAEVGSSGMDRAYINFVQGSWPLYQAAYNSRNADPEPARIIRSIDRETTVMLADHAAGLAAMRDRMSTSPMDYLRWYLSKSYLLWDWDVRIGDGGPYVHKVRWSELEVYRPMQMATVLIKAANPWLFVFALASAFGVFWRRVPIAIPALCFLYLTAVHMVLQADPRYATAYRSIEIVLAVSTAAQLLLAARNVARRSTLTTAPATTITATDDLLDGSPQVHRK